MKTSPLANRLTVKISAASLLMPLEPGNQPQLELQGELDNGRTLHGEHGEDLTKLPWKITIDRQDEDESLEKIDTHPEDRGSACALPDAGKPEYVGVTYAASAQTFDRLESILAGGAAEVRLVLQVTGVNHDPKRIALEWPDARACTAVTSVKAEVKYDV
ncbi:hypothetical protein [Stenotrophomonas sp. 57]|uniref:hypothetical protein n=1 Tax=Stenotrophomonas sp. 57 TaxID=3051119 RepID=UPI00256F57CC|nr:hypothetical protein [Stenotrophomonas sp. 57]